MKRIHTKAHRQTNTDTDIDTHTETDKELLDARILDAQIDITRLMKK